MLKEPYNEALTTPRASLLKHAVTNITTVPAIAKRTPTPWDIAFAISSPRLCPLKLILNAKNNTP